MRLYANGSSWRPGGRDSGRFLAEKSDYFVAFLSNPNGVDVPASEKKPFRIWLQVSENDNGSKTSAEGRRNWVIANSRLAKILKDKGYAYQFVYSKGAGHTQRKVINNTLPQALEYVWLDYIPRR